MAEYILKHFDRELIRFSARNTGDVPEVSITYTDREALSLMPLGMELSDSGLARWLKGRKIPRNRAYIHTFLAKAGLSANSTMSIMEVSKGLSLNDSYWVVPAGFEKSFDQCNLYENRLSEILAGIAFTGYGSSVRTSLASSPEYTTNGMLPKCWRRMAGRIYLYKGGTSAAANAGNEPYSEYYACQVARVLGVDAIPYTLTRWKSRLCSRCELFTSKETAFVPVGNIVKSGGMQAVIAYYRNLAPAFLAALEDMLVFDAVIANTDRHFGNFGFLVDARSNRLIGPAPLFDHGNSMFNFASEAELQSRDDFLAFADA
ncbi:MAG: XRE family transcriptional regulator, partial [Desulfovibrionaceae bacterium]|nr:XRE family transcriptional regulator [Desulfovibrionaceae bacterium]